MKKIIKLIAAAMIPVMQVVAQNNDAAKIAITPFVSEQVEGLPDGAKVQLENKMSQIVTENGFGGDDQFSRFIITPNIIVGTKDIIASAPPMTALTLNVTFYIGDGFEGVKFAYEAFDLKGVGINENKAYLDAIKKINPKDEKFKKLMDKGKAKIIEYYNTRCDLILKEAKALESQLKYEEALYKLTSVPSVCTACFAKTSALIAPVYQKFIDRDCKKKLQEANAAWSANQNPEGAEQVAAIIATIDPNAACSKDVKALGDKVAARIKEINNREWSYKFLEKDRIQAARDVGVAYGNGQPKSISYIVRGWY